VENGTDGAAPKIITGEDGEETNIYVKERSIDAEAPSAESGMKTFYEDYKLAATYTTSKGDTTQDPQPPAFTRDHYKPAGWEGIDKQKVNDEITAETLFTGDTQFYQIWAPNTFTVKFEMNGKGSQTIPSITDVNEALSAAGGLKKADKNMPTDKDVGIVTEGEGGDAVKYTFVNWADLSSGGNVINESTPLYPAKDEYGAAGTEVKLYAQWRGEGPEYLFTYKGEPQELTVSKEGKYLIEVWGAGSGDASGDDDGGYGGYISGEIYLKTTDKLFIYVGGKGAKAIGTRGARQAGGWNGGGESGKPSGLNSGGGGHGATDIREVGGNWDDATSLASRIIVAGGGGGSTAGSGASHSKTGHGGLGIANGGTDYGYAKSADKTGTNENAIGSAGGGTVDVSGSEPTGAGGAPSDATSGAQSGSLGKGGLGGGNAVDNRGGGGGGGGYYGGAGFPPEVSKDTKGSGGGGGGSSWAQTKGNGLKFTKIIPETGTPGGGTNKGNGKAKISFISSSSS
jgi:hypothetical protein